jgi:hypothetical protein
VPASVGHGVPDGTVPVHGDRHGNDPSASPLRAERGRGNQQNTNADPVDGAGLSDHPQQSLPPPRLDTRLGEHTQLGNGAVGDCDKNGQHARGLKR